MPLLQAAILPAHLKLLPAVTARLYRFMTRSSLYFQSLPDSGFQIYYSPTRNEFRVLGKLRVRYSHRRDGFDRIIDNDTFLIRGNPEVVKEFSR